jgi:hypothetical protein
MTPLGYCQCGCGTKTTPSLVSNARLGLVRGQPNRYVNNHHRRRPAEQRFWEKVKRTKGCWEWQGHCTQFGHGQLGVATALVYAHRFAYELLVGQIPDGCVLHHLCSNPACVNPAHLEPMTQAEHATLHATA